MPGVFAPGTGGTSQPRVAAGAPWESKSSEAPHGSLTSGPSNPGAPGFGQKGNRRSLVRPSAQGAPAATLGCDVPLLQSGSEPGIPARVSIPPRLSDLRILSDA